MRARWVWICALGTICIVSLGVFLWNRTERLPRARIDEKRELRVLQVSLGTRHFLATEPLWKRAARRLGLQRWGRWLGPARDVPFLTPHDALVLFVEEMDLTTGRVLPSSLDYAEALLPDGTNAKGIVSRRGNYNRAMFSVFSRGERSIPFRLKFGTNIVEITLRNPRPAIQSTWTGFALPQTNTVAGTEIVLHRLTRLENTCTCLLHSRDINGESSGWRFWRLIAFDSSGNWVRSDALSTRTLRFDAVFPRSEPVWKLRAEASEYVSAAFVTVPTNGEHIIIPPKSRLQRQGIQFLMWAGPGKYTINDRFEVRLRNAGSGASNSTPSSVRTASNASWELNCGAPGVLWISDGAVPSSVRLRERLENSGRIFSVAQTNMTFQSRKDPKQTVHFFAPRLPNLTTNLEIEVILNLPAAEFFVTAPERAR